MISFKKKNLRRDQVRKNIGIEKFPRIGRFLNANVIYSLLLVLLFDAAATCVISIEHITSAAYLDIIPAAVIIIMTSIGICCYISRYQKRIMSNHTRAAALIGLFILLLATSKTASILSGQQNFWSTGTAITAAIILSIAYDQRFAIGMSIFYCVFACFTVQTPDINLFLTMSAGTVACCFSLNEIRTRMKLLEVGVITAVTVFISFTILEFWVDRTEDVFLRAVYHAVAAMAATLLIQSILPLIEKFFKIVTSMTLLDYSDANQPLLKRLAMEAPGTYSHSLLVGSIAEAAAESIGRNGLLCRVGAYYHDIGKINKPGYFIENEVGRSRHKELSPAMSQLIVIGHVKDGIEMAKEYGLPAVLRQFIQTHHGTTLIEYFYNEAIKKQDDKQAPPSESEFRYSGPKPRTKEAAIVMLVDAVESASRSLQEVSPTKIETLVNMMAMKRLQDGQFDECDISLRELSQIESSISRSIAAHYHGRIAYPNIAEQANVQTEPPHQDNNG